ncbi:MAG TPA: chemoreceptor glutamine deamidase CheD, partial [Trinickia sp.]|nr:chemoreceptor glutamine deamidase CheD [Trinickia sp.]
INIGDRNSEFVRRYLGLEKIRIVAEDLQGQHPRKVAFMPYTGQAAVKKLRLQQEPSVAEREQALAKQTAELRAARHARAREHVELFAAPASKPRVELFGGGQGGGAATSVAAQSANKPPATGKPRIELFGASAGSSTRPTSQNSPRTVEEA